VVVTATFAAYVPAMRGGYVWDDDQYLYENELLTEPGCLRAIWTSTRAPQYYPLVFTSFWIETRLWGFGFPAGFHAVNVALHSLSAVLVWMILGRVGVPGAWFAGAVFALHPVHVESVAWITERKNVLSGMFYLLALLAYLRSEERRHLTWYLASLALFVLALLSKTVTCTLPLVILLIGWLRRRPVRLADCVRLAPMFLLGLAFGLLTAWYEKHRVGAQGTEWDLSFFQQLLLAARAPWFYAGKLLWPAKLTFVYPRWRIDDGSAGQWLWFAATLAVVAGSLLLVRRAGRGPAAAVLFFGVTLGPALGFIDVYPMRYSFVADHFQYLASLGIIALFVGGVARLLRAKAKVGATIGVAVLAVLAGLTFKQGHAYKDQQTLWRDTIAKNEDAWMAHNNLGVILARRGEHDAAVTHYRRALISNPDNVELHNNLGVTLAALGLYDEAIAEYLEALRLQPLSREAHNNLGQAYTDLGRLNEALHHLRIAANILPESAKVCSNLGMVLARLERWTEAETELRKAIRIDPKYASSYHNLGVLLSRTERVDEAIDSWKTGLQRSPDSELLLYSLAWTLATAANPQHRDGPLAVALATRLCEVNGFREPTYVDALGAAFAEAGRSEEAIRRAEQAAQLARAAGREDLAGRIENRISLYQKGQPYRQNP